MPGRATRHGITVDRLKLVTLDGGILRAGAQARLDVTVWAWGTADVLDVYTSPSAASPSWALAGSAAATSSGPLLLSVPFTVRTSGVQAVRAVFRYGGTQSPCPTGGYDDKDDLVFVAQ